MLTPPMEGDFTWQSPQVAWQELQDFLKTFSSKIFASSCGHPLDHPVALADRRVVERFLVGGRDFLVALPAEGQIVGGPFHHPLMGRILVFFCFIALVALDATLLEVLVRLDELAVDEKTQVVGLRLDRRRRPRSALALALGITKGLQVFLSIASSV